jgi:hypothetical protein
MSIEGRGGDEVSEVQSSLEPPKTNELSPEVDKRNTSDLEDINKSSSGSDANSNTSSESHPENERLPDKSDGNGELDSEPAKKNSEISDEKNRLPESTNEKPSSEDKNDPETHYDNRELPDSGKLPDAENKNDAAVGGEPKNNELPKENEPLDDYVKTTEPNSTEQSKQGEPTKIDVRGDRLDDEGRLKEVDPKDKSTQGSERIEHPKDDDSLEKDTKKDDNKDTEHPKNSDQSDGSEKNDSSDNIEPSDEDTDQPVKRIPTKNKKLEGSQHPETGVPFDLKTVKNSEGEPVEAVVPEFDSTYDTQLPEGAYRANEKSQFDYCNSQLNDAAFNPESEKNDPELAGKFTSEQQEDIRDGKTPEGYTWHHDAEPGKMQLVDLDTHADTGHTGGRTIWGGGSENR